MQKLYNKTYKTLLRETKDNISMEKYTMFMDWKTHIAKMLHLTKLIYRFSAILIKIPVRFFFVEINGKIPKFIQKCKGPGSIKIYSKRTKLEEWYYQISSLSINYNESRLQWMRVKTKSFIGDNREFRNKLNAYTVT